MTPTDALRMLLARENDRDLSNARRFIYKVLIMLCKNVSARYNCELQLKNRISVLESKMNDIHPDLN
jgi:hypothetical protein